eukprot:361118-Chlamydomonas_euryale.AAC.8
MGGTDASIHGVAEMHSCMSGSMPRWAQGVNLQCKTDPQSHLNARPDPQSHLNARPDPQSHLSARPDPQSHLSARPDPHAKSSRPSALVSAPPAALNALDTMPEGGLTGGPITWLKRVYWRICVSSLSKLDAACGEGRGGDNAGGDGGMSVGSCVAWSCRIRCSQCFAAAARTHPPFRGSPTD